MVLPRAYKRIQEQNPKLGKIILYLTKLAKVERPSSSDTWFYYLFLSPRGSSFNTIDDILVSLSKAWWLDSADIISQLMYLSHKFDFISKKEIPFQLEKHILIILGRNLRDYIMQQFRLHRNIEPIESKAIQDEDDIVFEIDYKNIFTLHERYILYNLISLGFTQDQIAEILLTSRRGINRILTDIETTMEDYNGI